MKAPRGWHYDKQRGELRIDGWAVVWFRLKAYAKFFAAIAWRKVFG